MGKNRTIATSRPAAPSQSRPGFNENDTYRRGLAKHRQGDLDGAEFCYRAILDRNPNHIGAWHFLGLVSHARGRSDEALNYLEKSILFGPTKAVFYNNYGAVLMSAKRDREAAIALGKALEIDPKHSDALSNLEQLRNGQGDHAPKMSLVHGTDRAATPAQKIDERFRRGMQCFAREKFVEANRAFHEAASLPGGRELWRWKSLGFCPTVFASEQEIERYLEKLDHGLDTALQADLKMDWRSLPTDGFTPSFNLPHLDHDCRPIKEKFFRLFEKAFPQQRPDPAQTREGRGKTRLGFVVLAAHHFGFIRVNRALLQKLDPKKFEIRFFSEPQSHAVCRERVGRDDISWIALGNRFDDMVRQIRDQRCDIVYHWKVGGSPLDYFLPFAKLAPVQCTSFGTLGTSGVGGIDHYISSNQLESDEARKHYTEQLVLLDSYATTHEPDAKPVATRTELGLPESGAVYFCPHRLAKYHPRFDSYLKGILERDPDGHIVLLTGNRPEIARFFAARLRKNLGKTLMKRVVLQPLMPHGHYRKFLSVATCVLDSPIYAGDLTTHDAFDYDVPVVTQEGPYLVQKYTSGLYRSMGLESLVTDSEGKYVELAVRFGTDSDYREEIRRSLGERKENSYAVDRVVAEYERFFERIARADS